MIAAVLLASACPSSHSPSPSPVFHGTPPDGGGSLASLSPACDRGDGSACMLAGRLYEFAHGVDTDLAKALSLYERSCALGYGPGCYNVAVLLEKSRQNLGRAAALYQQVCATGSPTACAAAARLAGDGGAP